MDKYITRAGISGAQPKVLVPEAREDYADGETRASCKCGRQVAVFAGEREVMRAVLAVAVYPLLLYTRPAMAPDAKRQTGDAPLHGCSAVTPIPLIVVNQQAFRIQDRYLLASAPAAAATSF